MHNRATTGNMPLPELELEAEFEDSFCFSQRQSSSCECGFRPHSVEHGCPPPFFEWKSLRNVRGLGSDTRSKLKGLKPDSLCDFLPEACPASFLNVDRDCPGTMTVLPRDALVFSFNNTQTWERGAL